jgi:hypothetical protein
MRTLTQGVPLDHLARVLALFSHEPSLARGSFTLIYRNRKYLARIAFLSPGAATITFADAANTIALRKQLHGDRNNRRLL